MRGRCGVAGRRAALAVIALGWVGMAAAAPLHTLAPGVYLHRGVLEDWGPRNDGDVANSGIVIGSRCAAVIDSGGSAAAGRRLLAALRRVTPLPVCYIINTHAHPDHVLGNAVFAAAAAGAGWPAPRFVGHARLAAALAARGPAYARALERDFGVAAAEAAPIVAPTLLVERRMELDLGGRKLRLDAWPTAHTDADLSVLDEASGTLFLGDLLFTSHVPVVDGRLTGWLDALSKLASWPVRIAVPGHGPPGKNWPGALAPQRRYLEQLRSDVRRAIADGVTLAQAVERIKADRPSWRLLEVFHARNVTAAYAELEWE